MTTPTFQGELMLAGWQESHTSGAKITFWLPDSESLEVFKGMTAKKGNTAGQRFMAVLVEIGEDEKPVIPEEKPKGGELARLAAMWCKEPKFWEWMNLEYGPMPAIDSEQMAAGYVRFKCVVKSRTELDVDTVSANRFHSYIRIPYSEWLRTHG